MARGQEAVTTGTLHGMLAAACDIHADRLAVADETEQLTYCELAVAARAVADELAEAGLLADEPVMVATSNRARDLAAFQGVWLAGGIVVPVHRTANSAGLADLLGRTGARFCVNARPDLEATTELRPGTGTVRALGAPPPPSRPLLAGAALIVFTSGTTGEPKGVVQTHRAYAGKLGINDKVLPFTPADRVLIVLQLVFAFAHWVSLLTLARGGAVFLREKFEPRDTIAALDKLGITKAPLVPTMIRQMLPLMDDVPSQRYSGVVMTGGEILPAAVGRGLLRQCPDVALWDFYGLTETCTSDFILNAAEYGAGAGTIGRAAPQIAYRVRPDGELQIRTPFAMAGYLDAPDLTAAAFEDGWFRTGDLAEVGPDGLVTLTGRLKELVNRAGNKVAPVEIERAYLEHPDVSEALATGVPDEVRGETVHLLIVPRPGTRPTEGGLLEWARGRLDRYKLPDRIHVADVVPVGRTGKSDRRALSRLILEGKFQAD